MDKAVAHHKIVNMEKEVVCGYLLEHLRRDVHRRRLVFNYHARTQRAVVKHTVASQTLFATTQLHFVGKKSLGITLVVDEIMYEMLAHPLLGSQCHMATAKDVEYGETPGAPLHTYLIPGKIQFLHVIYI